MLFHDILIVEGIAALLTELGRIIRISRFPAALVAAVERRTGRLGLTALRAELALVNSAALADPTVSGNRCRLGLAALGTELL